MHLGQADTESNSDDNKHHAVQPATQTTDGPKCPSCHLGEEPGDAELGIVWYGCDICPRWWHRHCLNDSDQAVADLSCLAEDVLFRCPSCPIEKICSVCLITGTTGYIQCTNCTHFYHEDCLPQELLCMYKLLTIQNKDWTCSRCDIEK